MQALLRFAGAGLHDRRQDVGLSCHRGAARLAGREPGHDRDSVAYLARQRPRGDLRRRAFLRRLEGQPRVRRRRPLRAAAEAGARMVVLCDTNGGSMPEEIAEMTRQAVRCLRVAARAGRHPLPQRLRSGGGQFAGRGRCRRGPGAGHDQRLRRALRQRRPDLGDRQPGPEEEGLPGAGGTTAASI